MSVADFKKLAYREDHQAPRQGEPGAAPRAACSEASEEQHHTWSAA